MQCEENGQYSHLQIYENNIAEKTKEIINLLDTQEPSKNKELINESNDDRNSFSDGCIILSKYHDEGKDFREC